MHIEGSGWAVLYYLKQVFVDNVILKFLAGAFGGIILSIYGGNEYLMKLMVFLYAIDFITGLAKGIKYKNITSSKLFKGSIKLSVYLITLIVGHASDAVLHSQGFFLGFMFAYIILSDAISILENLHILGFNVPFGLIKYFQIAQEKLFDKVENLLQIDKQDLLNFEKKIKDKAGLEEKNLSANGKKKGRPPHTEG